MTRLWFVRHGPTHAKAMIGWTDLPADLSDVVAINRLRQALPDAPLVSSDLLRTRQTADALAPTIRLENDPRLREINFGAWEGQSFAQAEAADPARLRAYWEKPGDIAPPNGESWNAVRARVDPAIDGHLALGHRDLIIVAHFGVILTQVQRAQGISAYQAFAQKIDNLSITRIDATPKGLQTVTVNQLP